MKALGIFLRKKEPRYCEECGENEAFYKFTYLLGPSPRTNAASSAYGRDDCSWCSDEDVFVCKECTGGFASSSKFKPDGYVECGRFENGERFAHMFEEAVEMEIPELLDELEESDATICRLCKRLNPQHTDCASCQDRENILTAIAKAKGK